MSTPPRPVKVICPRCHMPYVDWLRHLNPRLDSFDEAYLEVCSSVTCPHCSFRLTSDDMAYFEEPGTAAPVVRLEEGIELENWEGERWSWHPRQPSGRLRQLGSEDWLWLFGSATACHRWRYDSREVPKVAPEGGSPSFAQALKKHDLGRTSAEVYLALARRWYDIADPAQIQEPQYQVVAVEDVTHVLSDFCTSLIREQCESTEITIKNLPELYQQTYLALGGFLLPQEVTALCRKLRRTARYTEDQKDVLWRWRSLLRSRHDLLDATNLNILFYALHFEVSGAEGTKGLPTVVDAVTHARARLEGLLLDELDV